VSDDLVEVESAAGGTLAAAMLDLDEVSASLETASAHEIVAWAVDQFGDDLVLASSFQNAVLIDVAVSVDPSVSVVFIDTGYHFEETLEYVATLRRRYDLDLSVVEPEVGPEVWRCGAPRCCEVRKVAPLARALEGRKAWLSGLRRTETMQRAEAAIVSVDSRFGLVKINPLATWDDAAVARYAAERDLPVHPLAAKGYLSIGCAPTTAPVEGSGDHRSGRWPGEDKTECGLHF
jgi:phosphoadenosine phosphosulfate reductase